MSLTISGLFLLSSAMTDQFSCILSPWIFLSRRVRDSVKDVEPATKMRIFGLIYWEHII